MGEFFSMIGEGIGNFFSSIGDAIATAISNLFGKLLYYITIGLMYVVQFLQKFFDVFSGMTKVKYLGEYTYMTDVFFQYQPVKNVYWAMSLIGIALVLMFAIIAVIRKMFDLRDKHQNQSLGSIIGGTCKSILTMLLLGAVLNAALSITNVVINRIDFIFSNSDSFSKRDEITFTDEQFAAMGRVYTTIGNFSLNESYDNRYNLNKCFNEIRGDLNYLERQGVFDFAYDEKKLGKEDSVNWQNTLQKLVYAANTTRNVSMDKYNEEVSQAILEIMTIIRTNPKFYPLKEYENGYTSAMDVGLDRILFLAGTSDCANNELYNREPYLTDGLRGAFYTGKKDIYDIDQVKDAFKIGVGGIDYIFIWILTYFTLRNLFRCIFVCISRLYNMASLYVVAPLAIAPMPMDDGEKFKQWTSAMVIQVVGILGTIIPMRLMLLFAPVILGSDLVLFESGALNFIGKVLLVIGGMQAVESFSNMITGILTGNAASASANANDRASAFGSKAFGVATGIAGRAAKTGLGLVGSVTGLNTLGKKIGEGLSKIPEAFGSMDEHWGAIGSIVHAARGGGSDKAAGAGGKGGAAEDIAADAAKGGKAGAALGAANAARKNGVGVGGSDGRLSSKTPESLAGRGNSDNTQGGGATKEQQNKGSVGKALGASGGVIGSNVSNLGGTKLQENQQENKGFTEKTSDAAMKTADHSVSTGSAIGNSAGTAGGITGSTTGKSTGGTLNGGTVRRSPTRSPQQSNQGTAGKTAGTVTGNNTNYTPSTSGTRMSPQQSQSQPQSQSQQWSQPQPQSQSQQWSQPQPQSQSQQWSQPQNQSQQDQGFVSYPTETGTNVINRTAGTMTGNTTSVQNLPQNNRNAKVQMKPGTRTKVPPPNPAPRQTTQKKPGPNSGGGKKH